MPQETSTRRVISRTKGVEAAAPSEAAPVAVASMEKEKLMQRTASSSALLSNYVNTNPYNEDLELEETVIDQGFLWRDQVTEKFRKLLETIKSMHQQPTVNKDELQICYKKGLLICSTLKKLNRVSHLRVNKARSKTNEEKNKVDEHHLELQNLLYEISHIQKEINKCLEFRSLDEDMNLESVEEFYKNAPIEISNPAVTRNDPHSLKLAQLDWELSERQSMKSKIKSLEQLIEVHQNEIKSKREQLDSLQPKLHQILDSCKPTLDYLNANFDDECTISDSVQLLPKPLYSLYMMMMAYRDTNDKTLKVEVIGEVELARKFDNGDELNLDEDESGGDSGADDDGENENYKQKSKSKLKKKSVNKKEKVFTPYPLSVRLSIPVKHTGAITLHFNYFNILKIVTVKPELAFDKDISHTDGHLLRPDSVFNCLYPNDNGTESPNISNKLLFSLIGVKSIESHTKAIGYPYKWAQLLCGLYYLNESDVKHKEMKKESEDMNKSKNGAEKIEEMQEDAENEDDFDNETDDIFTYAAMSTNKNEAKILQKILLKLKSRFRSHFVLQETVNSLRKGIIPTPTATPVIRQIISKLTSFRESNYEKFLTFEYTEHLVNSKLVNESDCLFYEMILTNGAAKLQAQVVVNTDYPNRAPLFAVNVNWKTDRNFKNDEAIRDIEREINICKDNFNEYDEESAKRFKREASSASSGTSTKKKNYEQFIKQINHLVLCFDIYLESESYYLKSNEHPRYKFFLNSVRGKDRKRPYSYLANRDIFVQRLNYDISSNKDEAIDDELIS